MNSKIAIFAMLLLLLPATAFAGTTCAAATVVPSDGRVVDFDFVAAAGTNFYQFSVSPNRSYSVEVRQDYDDVNTDLSSGTGSIAIFSDTACSTAVSGAVSTLGADPVLPANSFRDSFITGATVSNPAYRIAVTSASGSTVGRYISVRVSETTQFSPLYTTFSGFNTFYRVFNTTGLTITGTMTAFAANGSVAGTPATVTIAPYSSTLTIYTGPPAAGNIALNIPASNAGPAIFVHNGPPGGIVIDGFAGSFSNGVQTFPIKFVPVRDK